MNFLVISIFERKMDNLHFVSYLFASQHTKPTHKYFGLLFKDQFSCLWISTMPCIACILIEFRLLVMRDLMHHCIFFSTKMNSHILILFSLYGRDTWDWQRAAFDATRLVRNSYFVYFCKMDRLWDICNKECMTFSIYFFVF